MPSIWRFAVELSEPGIASVACLIQSDDWDEGQIREAIQKGKHSSYSFESDQTKPKIIGRVVYKEKVHVSSFRAEAKSIRNKIKELKAIEKARKSAEAKAEKAVNFKERKK